MDDTERRLRLHIDDLLNEVLYEHDRTLMLEDVINQIILIVGSYGERDPFRAILAIADILKALFPTDEALETEEQLEDVSTQEVPTQEIPAYNTKEEQPVYTIEEEQDVTQADGQLFCPSCGETLVTTVEEGVTLYSVSLPAEDDGEPAPPDVVCPVCKEAIPAGLYIVDIDTQEGKAS